jgi:hypothetical protein
MAIQSRNGSMLNKIFALSDRRTLKMMIPLVMTVEDINDCDIEIKGDENDH